jgi:uncharacterized protein YndB with AHSA1/START domain
MNRSSNEPDHDRPGAVRGDGADLGAAGVHALYRGVQHLWIGHHIGESDLAEAVIEAKVGGRWYERGVDGSECDWGTVLAYDPPSRLVMTWQLNGEFKYDPDPEHASEVEVMFTEDNGQTRVNFEHRHIERLGASAEELARQVAMPGGWPGILEKFGDAAKAAA